MSQADRDLGMHRPITRRDFLHGSVLLGTAALAPGAALGETGNYPPARTGLRGSHPGSYEVAHALAREGRRWPEATDTGEGPYDLVVVGAGISGLGAALLFRDAVPGARVLILDNHDDFGGHARRNEFHANGRMRLAWGGSINLEYPGYSRRALALLRRLGINVARLRRASEFEYGGPGTLDQAIYFDPETYAENRLLVGAGPRAADPTASLAAAVAYFPIPEAARAALARFLDSDADRLAPMSPAERASYLRRTSYRDFLRERIQLPDAAVQVLAAWPKGLWGTGIDVLPVSECLAMGMPGLAAVGGPPPGGLPHLEDEFVMFPDGNATVARLLVRALVPGVARGDTMEDVVGARFDYAALDRPRRRGTRIRLDATAVAAANVTLPRGGEGVAVTYVRGGEARRVHGRACVLACWSEMIPYLCPELPEAQKAGLRYGEKTPMLVSNVLLRDGRAVAGSGTGSAYCPGRLHANTFLAHGVSLGGYDGDFRPEAPTVLQLYGGIVRPEDGATMKAQFPAARRRLLETSFADLEREIRTHLAGMLGPQGLDPARDIRAITVNRWPHGYAYEYNSLEDPDFPPGEAPHEIGRARFGRIAVANSDSAAHAYVDGAIDAAYRAVEDLLG